MIPAWINTDTWLQLDGLATLVAASVVLGGTIWLLSSSRKPARQKSVSSLPGPKGQLLLGNMRAMMNPDIHLRLTRWACEYGGMYRLSMLGQPIVVVTDAAIASRLITRGPDELPKYSPAYDPSNQLGSRNKQRGIFTEPGGPKHAHVRKGLAPAFSTENMRAAFPIARLKAQELADLLAQAGASRGAVDVTMLVNACVLDIVGQVMFGMAFNALKDPHSNTLLHAVERALAEISARVTDPFRETVQALLPFLPSSRKVAADMGELYKVYDLVKREIRSRGPPAEGDTHMHVLLRKLTNPDTGAPISDDELHGNISAFLVGGFETTATTILWFLHALATHPDVCSRLEQELVVSGLVGGDGAPGREVEWGDLQGLPYFNAVLRESMRRYHTAGSTATFRVTHKDMEVGGYWLPQGTPVWIPLYVVANSPTNFVEPERFWPGRWHASAAAAHDLSNDGATETATPAGHASAPCERSSLPFSSGTRDCIGQALGLMQTRAILLTLLRNLRFTAVENSHEVESQQVMRLTVHSAVGFRFHVRARTASS